MNQLLASLITAGQTALSTKLQSFHPSNPNEEMVLAAFNDALTRAGPEGLVGLGEQLAGMLQHGSDPVLIDMTDPVLASDLIDAMTRASKAEQTAIGDFVARLVSVFAAIVL